MSNLLFHPCTRTEDGRTLHYVGAWLWAWRRYAPWTLERSRLNKWMEAKYPNVRVWAYRVEAVMVEL